MKIRNFLLMILIVISTICISVTAIYYRNSVYASYYRNPLHTTEAEAVFKAASSGVYPWAKPVKKKPVKKQVKTDSNKTNRRVVEKKEFTKVDDSYFDDALFIGDSRMVGLSQYCEGIDARATFYAKKSLTIFDIRDDKWIETDDGVKISLQEALSTHQFSKIYIMVGINELGIGNASGFRSAYEDVINIIQEYQPDALIFINSIMHVDKEKNDSDALYNNKNINLRNAAIMSLADNVKIFYININEAVDDENGNLNADTTSDGVHLKGASYEPWHEYLLTHGIL